jgi:hypothetical protein
LDMERLRSQAERLGTIEKGVSTRAVKRDLVVDCIDALDVGVLAHYHNFGSPVVLFEMMALGKPVVAPSLMPINDVGMNNQTVCYSSASIKKGWPGVFAP